jgi:hypothetical protein
LSTGYSEAKTAEFSNTCAIILLCQKKSEDHTQEHKELTKITEALKQTYMSDGTSEREAEHSLSVNLSNLRQDALDKDS